MLDVIKQSLNIQLQYLKTEKRVVIMFWKSLSCKAVEKQWEIHQIVQ